MTKIKPRIKYNKLNIDLCSLDGNGNEVFLILGSERSLGYALSLHCGGSLVYPVEIPLCKPMPVEIRAFKENSDHYFEFLEVMKPSICVKLMQ